MASLEPIGIAALLLTHVLQEEVTVTEILTALEILSVGGIIVDVISLLLEVTGLVQQIAAKVHLVAMAFLELTGIAALLLTNAQ
jgi:hypothetical protein